MEYRKLIFLILPLFIAAKLHAQCDTLVVYSVSDTTVEFIALECDPNPQSVHDKYFGSTGTMGNSIALADDTVTYPFTPLMLTENDYDLLSYPVRTNVALIYTDSIFEQGASCSGTLIAKNIVMTAAHCIGKMNAGAFFWKGAKELYVSPAHADGFPQSQIGKIKVTHAIIRKKYYDNQDYNSDFALLVLEQPVGNSIGWMGVSYFENDSVFADSMVSYYFGYPAKDGYDGKDMYYHYGYVYPFFAGGDFGTGITGIPGQSGGSVFMMDNGNPVTFGIQLTSSPGSGCSFITQDKFWAIQKVIPMFENVSSETELPGYVSAVEAYPVPAENNLTLNGLLANNMVHLELVNLLGQQVFSQQVVSDTETIAVSGLQGGIYLVRLINRSGAVSVIKILKT